MLQILNEIQITRSSGSIPSSDGDVLTPWDAEMWKVPTPLMCLHQGRALAYHHSPESGHMSQVTQDKAAKLLMCLLFGICSTQTLCLISTNMFTPKYEQIVLGSEVYCTREIKFRQIKCSQFTHSFS